MTFIDILESRIPDFEGKVTEDELMELKELFLAASDAYDLAGKYLVAQINSAGKTNYIRFYEEHIREAAKKMELFNNKIDEINNRNLASSKSNEKRIG